MPHGERRLDGYVMTIPVDLDTVSTATLATCHLSLIPISLLAIRRLH